MPQRPLPQVFKPMVLCAASALLLCLTLPAQAAGTDVTADTGNAIQGSPVYGDKKTGGGYGIYKSSVSVSVPSATGNYDGTVLGGAGAQVSADLAAGTLKASAHSSAAQDQSGGYWYNSAGAAASFDDKLTFSGVFAPGATGSLLVRFHGSVAGDHNPKNDLLSLSSATFQLVGTLYADGKPYTPLYFGHRLAEAGCQSAPANMSCTTGSFEDAIYRIAFPLDGRPLDFRATLRVDALGAANVNFGQTASFGLELPDGVSYSSVSKVFLSEAAPLPVPEPGSLALLVSGIALLGLRRARQIEA